MYVEMWKGIVGAPFGSARSAAVALAGSGGKKSMITMTGERFNETGARLWEQMKTRASFCATLVGNGRCRVILTSRREADNSGILKKFKVTHIVDVSTRLQTEEAKYVAFSATRGINRHRQYIPSNSAAAVFLLSVRFM